MILLAQALTKEIMTILMLPTTMALVGGDNAKIKLIITAGNVVHPHSKISILPPSSSSSTDMNVNVRVGANNLCEEESHF